MKRTPENYFRDPGINPGRPKIIIRQAKDNKRMSYNHLRAPEIIAGRPAAIFGRPRLAITPDFFIGGHPYYLKMKVPDSFFIPSFLSSLM
jgi:hypothetical protein